MSKEFEKALRVISKPPEQRQTHEIKQLVPWLRSKAKLFKGLRADILTDIIRNCHVQTKYRDDVVIKQGDIGDCFYILLNGQVTIFILNKDQMEGVEDDNDFSNVVQYTKEGNLDRVKLGYCVTALGPGAPFGDVALTSGDSIRTASIIADMKTELLVVDRALYNRSMKEVLAKEFQEKTTFIKNNPLFNNWPPKYRKQLAMALYKETFGYEAMLTRQGDRTEDMYFVISGQVEIQIDSSLHPQQYPLIFKAARENEVDKLIKKVSKPRRQEVNNNNSHVVTTSIKRKDSTKCTRLCHLGVNESVGDMELTMDLPSYAQHAVCKESTDVLVLEHKHYTRLFERRHPRTIESMRDEIGVKLASRLSMLTGKQDIPFLNFLQKIIESRHKVAPPTDKDDEPTLVSAEKDFLNHRGPLIDIHGPGSVFFLIKLRERTKRRLRAKRGDRFTQPTSQSIQPISIIPPSSTSPSHTATSAAYARPRSARGLPTQARSFRSMQDPIDPDTDTPQDEGEERGDGGDGVSASPMSGLTFENSSMQDVRLSTLEARVRLWLQHGRPRWKPQVAPMRRLVLEDLEVQPKPGNRIVVRRKDRHCTSGDTSTSSSAEQLPDSPRQVPRDSPAVTSRSHDPTRGHESPRSNLLRAEASRMAAYNILLTH